VRGHAPLGQLYHGDNLAILRGQDERGRVYFPTESVDLVYLDPPFNSGRDHNVLYAPSDPKKAAAQIRAFEDTWEWGSAAANAYSEIVEASGNLSRAMRAFRELLGDSPMMAYLAMMAPRLVELRRVLKPTGSLFLHCDPTASHYLKVVLDAVFGPAAFRNEIVWKRTGAHNGGKKFGPVHDVIFYYAREEAVFRPVRLAYSESHADDFRKVDTDGRSFQSVTLSGSGVRKGESGEPWREHDPTSKGRHWAIPRTVYESYEAMTGQDLHDYPILERLDRIDKAGLLHWPKQGRGGLPRYKFYANDAEGLAAQDIWADIPALNWNAKERLGYPTQKPEALLERIILAASDEGDVVLDPFCGCGTAIHAAQTLRRRWRGIDVTHLAIGLVKSRLGRAFPELGPLRAINEPTSVAGAEALAEEKPDGRFQFQCWALGLVGARKADSAKRGADGGIDGMLTVHEGDAIYRDIVISVKSGAVNVADVRDLCHVVKREKAIMGVLITLRPATKPMRAEAANEGLYQSPYGSHPRIQILTIEGLLSGVERIDDPRCRMLAKSS
jgi:DNA modification methylase